MSKAENWPIVPEQRFTFKIAFLVALCVFLASCGSSSSIDNAVPTPSDGQDINVPITDGQDINVPVTDGQDINVPVTDGQPVNEQIVDEQIVDPVTLSDEFDVDSLDQWSLLHQTEGRAAQFSLLDINQTTVGALTIQPTLTPGWFAAEDAPLIYRAVSGNFAIETDVSVTSVTDPALPPTADFNSAGLMARTPAETASTENYIMINIGRQNASIAQGIGSEHKSTLNSASTLNLQAGSTSGRLLICRIGDEFITYRFLDFETQWTELIVTTRDDMPETLQVGLVANGFSGPDIRATFDYARFRVPESRSDCLP